MLPRTRAVVWLLGLAAPLAAQHKAPFRGVVRDPAGAPLAGTQVVCAWSPDGSSLAEAEQHTTTTDAAGRFAVDLAIGRAYCVWAIGPADTDGHRRVVGPAFTAVGGRTLDLVADRVMAPVQLKLTGASTWQQAGPLALRIVVAAGAALPDFVIAGDGTIDLPPLPTTQCTVCLLDFRRDVIDSVEITAEPVTACDVTPATAATFVVVDADDKPVAGASIRSPQHVPVPHRLRFTDFAGSQRSLREVAVTGADGTARGLVAVKPTMWFVARHEDECSGIAGVVREQRIENGVPSTAEAGEPYRLRLVSRPPRSVQFAGAGDDVLVHAVMYSQVSFRLRNGGGGMTWPTALTREGDRWTGSGPGTPHMRALGEGTGPRPLRVAAWTQDEHFDLTTLRHLAVQVVDADGRAAPFATVGISHSLQGFPVRWTTHLATDAEGRAELRVMPGDCELYATTPEAHGYTAITDATATEATVQLQPMARVRVRIVDRDGRPVAGARVEMTGGSLPNAGIGRVAHAGFGDPFSGLCSDANGLVVAHMPRELAGQSCVAKWRNTVSPQVRLPLDQQEPVELRLSR